MNRVLLSLILCAVAASLGVLWLSELPLGIPGEWTWDRVATEPDSVWNLIGATLVAALYVAVVHVGWNRLSLLATSASRRIEVCGWLATLVGLAFAWLWIVQEAAPLQNRLGKSAFVLYYPSSSGYFTKARYEAPHAAAFLAGYEDLMRERDVLHVGTHPPGLFLVFHGLIAACEQSPALAAFLDATQPTSFRDACDIIATNTLRTNPPRPLLPLDRRVLWLATLLVMLSAALVVVPLFGVVRQTHGDAAAWLSASLWPAVPAVAVFVPKSDVVYALIGMLIVWTWLVALRRRSVTLAVVAGLLAWCGLMCSLAFLPVFLFTALVSFGGTSPSRNGRKQAEEPLTLTLSPQGRGEGTGEAPTTHTLTPELRSGGARRGEGTKEEPLTLTLSPQSRGEGTGGGASHEHGIARRGFEWPPLKCVAAAVMGFAIPTVLVGWLVGVNLLTVWWLNYQNHAGFYRQYTRTYWKWLLVNPVELCFAAGVPLALLAAASLVALGKERRSAFARMAWPMVFVGGTLWLTGKNSGEAARLWIVFLPWLVWLAGPWLAEVEVASVPRRLRPAWVILMLQCVVGLLTVTRVCGFHFD